MAKKKPVPKVGRRDPYKDFKFRLKTAAVSVGRGIGRVTALPVDRLRKALSRDA